MNKAARRIDRTLGLAVLLLLTAIIVTAVIVLLVARPPLGYSGARLPQPQVRVQPAPTSDEWPTKTGGDAPDFSRVCGWTVTTRYSSIIR